uniref:Uncharacterized protein n=1 Tax=Salix viminalis TaxID=40686 RepID=A0A6N2LTS3_SALVM
MLNVLVLLCISPQSSSISLPRLLISLKFLCKVAFEEARKYEGRVVLGDRPVHITLLYSLLFQALFLPSSEDLEKMVYINCFKTNCCSSLRLWK